MLSFQELDDLVYERLNSHQWWFFLGNKAMAEVIEERFYSGDANADFEVIMGGGFDKLRMIGEAFNPFMDVVSMAHKRRCSAEDLAAFLSLRVEKPINAGDLEERDILYGLRG
jgi:hypothetical protein